jgi:hypothetical protein
MFVSYTVGHAEFRGRTAFGQSRILPDKDRPTAFAGQMTPLLFNHLE